MKGTHLGHFIFGNRTWHKAYAGRSSIFISFSIFFLFTIETIILFDSELGEIVSIKQFGTVPGEQSFLVSVLEILYTLESRGFFISGIYKLLCELFELNKSINVLYTNK